MRHVPEPFEAVREPWAGSDDRIFVWAFATNYACGPRWPVACWGRNVGCVLGDPDTVGSEAIYYSNFNVAEWSEFRELELAEGSAAILTEDGQVYRWGETLDGQTNSMSHGEVYVCEPYGPIDVPEGPVKDVSLRRQRLRWHGPGRTYELCILSEQGNVWCKGETSLGIRGAMLADPEDFDTWTRVEVPDRVKRIALGRGLFLCVLTETGHVYCTGSNELGQLGIGDPSVDHVDLPVEVTLP